MDVESIGAPGSEAPQELARRLNLPFSDHRLLSRALTHRSYLNEHPEALEDNERLEFLGDAVLDFLVGGWLYNHFPELREGELTRLRSALVRTDQLAEFGEQIQLGRAMRLGRGEIENRGHERPALLCGMFEALVGALYLNAGLEAVAVFMEPLLHSTTEIVVETRRDRDPKSLLQEWAQAQGLGAPHYRTVSASGPEHERRFEMEVIVNEETLGSGMGSSKQQANKAAARAALKRLGLE